LKFHTATLPLIVGKKIIIDLDDIPGLYEGTTSIMLTIFNVHEQNEGDYHCNIDNIIMSEAAELSVGKLI
jgi:hypothetical protein